MAYDGSIKFSIDIDQDLAEDKLNELKSNLDDMANELSKKDLKYGEKLASDFDKTNQSIAETINKLREAEAQLERIQFDMQDWEATGGGENLELTQAYESAKLNVNELKQSLSEMIPEQQSLTNRTMVFSDKIIESKNNSVKLSKETDNVSKAMNRSSRSAKSMSDNIGGGVKKVLRYGLALFSIRSIYTMLSRLSREWMNSNDVAAKQMNANVQALSNGLQNLLAPILQTIMGWITTLMGYVNALTKAFFGVSIFTAKTNKNLGGSVGNAKKLSKEAKKFTASFDDAEVATSKMSDNLAGGGGGTGVGDLPAPNIPEPNVDWIVNWVDKLIKALDPFISTIKSIDLQPLQNAFEVLGNSILNILGIIGKTMINMLNNTVAPFIKLFTEELAPNMLLAIAKVLDALALLLEYILVNLVEPLFHWFMMEIVPRGIFLITEALNLLAPVIDVVRRAFEIVWEDVWKPLFSWLGSVALVILDQMIEFTKALTGNVEENEDSWVDLLVALMKVGSYALIIIGVMKTVGAVVGFVQGAITILTGALGFVKTAFVAVKAIVVAITSSFAGVIAIVGLLGIALVGIVTNFEQNLQAIKEIVGNIKGVFSGLIDFIAGVFTGDWARAWKGVVSIFENIIKGIVNIFKFPINAMIDGLNFFIRGVNKIKIPNWVPGVGGKGINIGQIPRLAKGGVLNRPTLNIAGEAGKEAVVPLENNTGWAKDFLNVLDGYGGVGNSQPQVIQLVVDSKVLAEVVNEQNEESNFSRNGGGMAWSM